MMPVIESYYMESTEGLLFAVKGLIHPPQAVVAYLRYAPHPSGDRNRETFRYRRLYSFKEQDNFLQDKHPAYLFFDPIFGEQLQGVPRECIRRVYDPCLKLSELSRRKDLDELEEKAVEFAGLLVKTAKVPEGCIGVSGSILISLHKPGSDIDLVVYGSKHCRSVQASLRKLFDEAGSGVQRLDKKELRELYAFRSQDTPMTFEEFVRLEERKVIQGKFSDCDYFIRFVKSPPEVRERYGDRKYIALGPAEIEATVVDAGEAIFTPCTYIIKDVKLKGTEEKENTLLREIVSFRGRFCEQQKEGERVIARGKQEKVITREGEVYYRLLLGRPGDFMVSLP